MVAGEITLVSPHLRASDLRTGGPIMLPSPHNIQQSSQLRVEAMCTDSIFLMHLI